MKTPPPLRDYKQMARVVRTEQNIGGFDVRIPYKIGYAYGSEPCGPTETRERTLDEAGINSRTCRQGESDATDHYLTQRETIATYHQLNTDQQCYFRGINPNTGSTRLAGWPGTKSRVYLSSPAPSQQVTIKPPDKRTTAGHKRPETKQNDIIVPEDKSIVKSPANKKVNRNLSRAEPSVSSPRPQLPNEQAPPSPASTTVRHNSSRTSKTEKNSTLTGVQGTSLDFSLK